MRTPKFHKSIKTSRRTTDLRRVNSTLGFMTPQFNFDRIRMNGSSSVGNLSLCGIDASPCDLSSIQDLLASNRNFSINVVEREFKIDVLGDKRKIMSSKGNSSRRLENYKSFEEKSPTKRQGDAVKASKVKKIRRKRAKKPSPQKTSNGLDLPDNNFSSNLTQPIDLLTLDEMSCGSSCSTVTSDDEKNFNPWKFERMREKKKSEHKQKKFLERTAMLNEVNVTKDEGSNSASSNDDFCYLRDSDFDEESTRKAESGDAEKGKKRNKKP